MVEVFKTDVEQPLQADKICGILQIYFPHSQINFDLDDCDKVLRIEGDDIKTQTVNMVLQLNGFNCKTLE